jgi:ankyrin repeat protein
MTPLDCEMLEIQSNGRIADTSNSYLINRNYICILAQEANIASFCLRYLTFECFNKSLPEKEIKAFLLEGYYAFEDYAVAYWIDHLTAAVSGVLQKCMSVSYSFSESVRAFLQQHAVRSVVEEHLEDSDFVKIIEACAHLTRDRKSTGEHLDLEHGIRRIRQALEKLVVQLSLYDHRRDSLAWFYGSDWFKCPRPRCDWFHEGFDEGPKRDRHVNQHNRPFCCTFVGCPATKLGYESEKRLRNHLLDSHPATDDGGWKFPLPKKKIDIDIYRAAANGDLETVKNLVEQGTDINKTSRPYGGQTAIYLAVRNMHLEVVKFLLAEGANVNFQGPRGTEQETALSLAASIGSEIMVKLLVENGANLESKDGSGETPLWRAASNGHEAVVKLLVENGANLESRDNNLEQTPLSWVADKGHETVVKLLIEKGADLESKDLSGRTPLLWAADRGHETVMKLLIEKGADLESKDVSGRTPLLWAADRGHKTVVKLLIEKGADLEWKDLSGRTPLSWAVGNGHKAVARLLVEKWADCLTLG